MNNYQTRGHWNTGFLICAIFTHGNTFLIFGIKSNSSKYCAWKLIGHIWKLTYNLEIPVLMIYFIGWNSHFPDGFTTSFIGGWYIQKSERQGVMAPVCLCSDISMIIISIKSRRRRRKRMKGDILGEDKGSLESENNDFYWVDRKRRKILMRNLVHYLG